MKKTILKDLGLIILLVLLGAISFGMYKVFQKQQTDKWEKQQPANQAKMN